MDIFHYDNAANIILNGNVYLLFDVNKKTKTRTITRNGWSKRIFTQNIKISPTTYWTRGNYDIQFEGYSFYCYLCNYTGTTPSECKCKKHFTLEEHNENVRQARKNYLLQVVGNLFPDMLPIINYMTPTPDLVDMLLYKINKNGKKELVIKYPPVFDFDKKLNQEILFHMNKVIQNHNTNSFKNM